MFLTTGDVVTDDEIRNRMELRSETMWVYNSNGMTVYSVEGELLNSVQKDEKCTYGGDLCNFNAIVSDNRKYVFAVQEMDDDTGYVTVHNLDTEQVVGLIPTCAKPVAIKYHSARHEMWITCATTGDEKSDGDEKSEANYNVDVIGAESLTSNHQQVSISTLSSGKVTSSVVHNDLGNVMYTSQSDSNVLTKVDLSSKEILETFSLFEGDDQGLFGMTYCNANKHMYAYTSENDLVEFDTVADSLVSKTVIPDFEFNKIVVKPEGGKFRERYFKICKAVNLTNFFFCRQSVFTRNRISSTSKSKKEWCKVCRKFKMKTLYYFPHLKYVV